jgi:hypothetical protein
MVASAAVLLLAAGKQKGSELSNGSYRSPRTGRTVYHCMTSEAVKAMLMAGADRQTTGNPAGLGNVTGYRRRRADRTENGLDRRFGAGQLNIDTAYRILLGGEFDSEQDRRSEGAMPPMGFDYDPAFGGADGSNRTASYRFVAPDGRPRLTCCLAWNLEVNGGRPTWRGGGVLYDLDLKLFDHTRSSMRALASSQSWSDTTENVHQDLMPGHEYEIRVVVPDKQPDFRWDYGLAWAVSANQ